MAKCDELLGLDFGGPCRSSSFDSVSTFDEARERDKLAAAVSSLPFEVHGVVDDSADFVYKCKITTKRYVTKLSQANTMFSAGSGRFSFF